MRAAADHTQLAELEPPVLNEPASADDIMYEYGLGSSCGDPFTRRRAASSPHGWVRRARVRAHR